MMYMLECGKPNNKPSNNIQQHGPSDQAEVTLHQPSSQVDPEVYSTQLHKPQVRMTILLGPPHYWVHHIIIQYLSYCWLYIFWVICHEIPWKPPHHYIPHDSQKSVLWLFSQPMLSRSFSVAAAEVLPTDPSYLQHLQAVLLGVSAAGASKDSDFLGKV